MMQDTREDAAVRIVSAILDSLRDRRPFKHDLAEMETDYPALYKEMLEEMKVEVLEVLKVL